MGGSRRSLKNVKLEVKRDDFVYEYDLKTMVVRMMIFCVFVLFVSFMGFKSYGNYFGNDVVEEYDSNLKDLEEHNYLSSGDFMSVDENTVVSGSFELVFNESRMFVSFKDFKVTKNKNLVPAMSQNVAGRGVIFLADRLLGTVGAQIYEVPTNLNLNEYPYFIFWDEVMNKPVAYAKLK